MTAVLDASAILALFRGEPGAALVKQALVGGRVSTVNWSEVLHHAARHGLPLAGLRTDIEQQGVTLVDFIPQDSEVAARLAADHPSLGLSLADRACLALAQRLGVPALTADRVWTKVPGIQVRPIR